MCGLKFEGVDAINEVQTEFVKSILEKHGCKDGKVTVETVGKVGDNYIANVLRITAEKNGGEYFKMIAKVAPQNPVTRHMKASHPLFSNEHHIYAEIFPKMKEQEEKFCVPEHERLRYPVFYGSIIEPPNEIILLEDLGNEGYLIFNRVQVLNDNSMKLALKYLAKFHSLSYVLKRNEPDAYKALCGKLINNWEIFNAGGHTKMFFSFQENDILSVLNDEKYHSAIKGTVSAIINVGIELSKTDANSKYSVIQHGDCWTNNIMYKLKDGQPIESIMIDYQQSKEMNPVADILNLILNCSNYEARLEHYLNWLGYYHAEMDKFLANFDLSATTEFPRSQLDADIKRYGKYALGSAILMTYVILRPTDDSASDVNEDLAALSGDFSDIIKKFSLKYMKEDDASKFKERIEQLVDSVLELGIL